MTIFLLSAAPVKYPWATSDAAIGDAPANRRVENTLARTFIQIFMLVFNQAPPVANGAVNSLVRSAFSSTITAKNGVNISSQVMLPW